MLCSRNLLGIPLRKLGEDVNANGDHISQNDLELCFDLYRDACTKLGLVMDLSAIFSNSDSTKEFIDHMKKWQRELKPQGGLNNDLANKVQKFIEAYSHYVQVKETVIKEVMSGS